MEDRTEQSDSILSAYSIKKLEQPLQILTNDKQKLVGVTEIGINNSLGIVYIIGNRRHFEREAAYTIIK